MGRSAGSFRRAAPAYKPRPRILVICEDIKSSKRYIEDAAIYFRVKVAVEVIHCGKTDPKGIVEEAINRQRDYEQVFCVIDRDSHAHWPEALRLADGRDGVGAIASYPCFEYWLILHFIANRKPYARQGKKSAGDCCVDDLKSIDAMSSYDKTGTGSIFDALVERLEFARRNAARVIADAKQTGELNPSTRLHELIEFLQALEAELD